MSVIRMINMVATQSERLALRRIDLVTGPMFINLNGEYVQEPKPDYEVSTNSIHHDEEDEGLFDQAIRILPTELTATSDQPPGRPTDRPTDRDPL